ALQIQQNLIWRLVEGHLRGIRKRTVAAQRGYESRETRFVVRRKKEHVAQSPALGIEHARSRRLVVFGRLVCHPLHLLQREPLRGIEKPHVARDQISHGDAVAHGLQGGVNVRPAFIEPEGNVESAVPHHKVHVFVDGDRIILRGRLGDDDRVTYRTRREISRYRWIRREHMHLVGISERNNANRKIGRGPYRRGGNKEIANAFEVLERLSRFLPIRGRVHLEMVRGEPDPLILLLSRYRRGPEEAKHNGRTTDSQRLHSATSISMRRSA